MRIAIIGGYGNAGAKIVRLLLRHTSHRLTVCGRHPEKGMRMFDADVADGRVECKHLDVHDMGSMYKVFGLVDLVIVASGTTDHAGDVARAALETNIDYYDILLPFPDKRRSLLDLQEDIEQRGRTFITDGGFHPGMPALLLRYIGCLDPAATGVQIGSMIRINWKELAFSEETVDELIDEFRHYENKIMKGNRKVVLPYSRSPRFTFSVSARSIHCTAMWLPELEDPGQEAARIMDRGFYIAGFNWFTDAIIIPFIAGALLVRPKGRHRWAGRLLAWSLRTFSRPPYHTELVVRKTEKYADNFMTISHSDPYFMTAAPVMATLFQYFETRGEKPGLWYQGHFPDPVRFIDDLERLGVLVDIP
jgi:saccharopine dehydrogenase (NAD+, L-lysine-forming)